MGTGQKLGYLINKHHAEIARHFVESLYDENADMLKEKEVEPEEMLKYAGTDVSRLFLAIVSERKSIFANYIKWQRSMLESRGIPIVAIKKNLQLFYNALKRFIPSEMHDALEEYIKAGLYEIEAQNIDIPSFLNENTTLINEARAYLEYVLNSNKTGALNMLKKLVDEGANIKELYLNVIQPVQYEIGRLWQLNKISVAEEHYATETSRSAIMTLKQRLNIPTEKHATVITTCMGGELHETGIRFVTDFYELSGWESYYVGANVPSSSMMSLLSHYDADLIAISTTMSSYLFVVEQFIKRLRESPHAKIPVLVGGNTFNQYPNLWREIGADGYAPNAEEAIVISEKILAEKRKAV